MKKRLTLFLCLTAMLLMLVGCQMTGDVTIIADETNPETENTEDTMREETTIKESDDTKSTIPHDMLVGLQKVKNCEVNKTDEKDMRLISIYDNSEIIVEAPADVMATLLSNKHSLLCYDGGEKVTVADAMDSPNMQFYDVDCGRGLCLLNSHDEGATFKTLLDESKWYVYMYSFEDIAEVYSLVPDENNNEFDIVLNQFGKPDDYILSGEHIVNFGGENVAFVYTMLVYDYDNYKLLIKVSEQYAVTDGGYELINTSVGEAYAMSHEGVEDYMNKYMESWGDIGIFVSLNIK